MKFGNMILRRRIMMCISQEELARTTGVSARTIRCIEADKGNPTLKSLEKVCNALDMEVAILYREYIRFGGNDEFLKKEFTKHGFLKQDKQDKQDKHDKDLRNGNMSGLHLCGEAGKGQREL